MIILEGSDCCGKTSAMAKIVKAANPILRERVQTAHLGLPPAGTRHWDIVRKELLTRPNTTIYDRMVVGSFVFRHIKPDKYNVNGVTIHELHAWQDLMSSLNAYVIHFTADYEDVLWRYRQRGDAYVNEKTLEDSFDMYQKVFADWKKRKGWGAFHEINTSKVAGLDLQMASILDHLATNTLRGDYKSLIMNTMGDHAFHDNR